MKVVWICNFSDLIIRRNLRFRRFSFRLLINVYNQIIGKPIFSWNDYGIWVSKAISEFEKFDDISLLVIFPHSGICGLSQSFVINGVNYFCYRPEDDYFYKKIIRRFLGGNTNYSRNRKLILRQIENYSPNFIHLIGAENPVYSSAFLDIDYRIPCLVSLQTLMSEKDFIKGYPISNKSYLFRTSIEKAIIRKAKYIASSFMQYKKTVMDINPNAVFLHLPLASGVAINRSESYKEYDFVYFSADIEKAGNYVVEVFYRAWKKNRTIRLNISGGFKENYRKQIEEKLLRLGLSNNVFITGRKNTHEEVLDQIRKSRFALIPIIVDMITSTVLESMANGLPVVTTKTPSTPLLNNNRESVLLSEIGDYNEMADNMLKLINDNNLAEKLRENAYITVQESFDNSALMRKWVSAYKMICENY